MGLVPYSWVCHPEALSLSPATAQGCGLSLPHQLFVNGRGGGCVTSLVPVRITTVFEFFLRGAVLIREDVVQINERYIEGFRLFRNNAVEQEGTAVAVERAIGVVVDELPTPSMTTANVQPCRSQSFFASSKT
jgi:hypothetical protein